MAYTYEDVIPTLIPNTIMQKRLRDGVQTTYLITAVDGYVLHDNLLDRYEDYDDDENPIGDLILGYYSGTRTVGANYDFTANPREFYAVPESSVPADRIFGGGNDHEAM